MSSAELAAELGQMAPVHREGWTPCGVSLLEADRARTFAVSLGVGRHLRRGALEVDVVEVDWGDVLAA
jgi:hypothetical protein